MEEKSEKYFDLYKWAASLYPLNKHTTIVLIAIILMAVSYTLKVDPWKAGLFALLIAFIASISIILNKSSTRNDTYNKILGRIFITFGLFLICYIVCTGLIYATFGVPKNLDRYFNADKIIDSSLQSNESQQNNSTQIFNIDNRTENVQASSSGYIKKKKITFSGNGVSYIQDLIKSAGLPMSNAGPDFIISTTYSGALQKVDDNLYRYNGGFIILKFNNSICEQFSEFILSPTFSGGNSEEFVLSTIEKEIVDFIENNQQTFIRKIKECVK